MGDLQDEDVLSYALFPQVADQVLQVPSGEAERHRFHGAGRLDASGVIYPARRAKRHGTKCPVPFCTPCGRPLSLLALTGKGRAADLFRPAPPEGRHRPEKKGNDFSAAQ